MTDNWEVTGRDQVAHLKQRIFELESGACRYNCRTAKEAFMEGFDRGMDQHTNWHGKEEAYKEWCEQKD